MSVLSDLVNAFESNVGKDIIPVILADAQQIEANPDLVLNPLTQPVEFAKLQGDILGALPQFNKDEVSDSLRIIVAYFQNIKIPTAQKLVAAKAAAAAKA